MELNGRLTLSFFLVLLFLYFANCSNETVTLKSLEKEPSTHFSSRMGGSSQFLLRKCCGPGQVYTAGGAFSNGSNQFCVDYGTSNHPASTLIEVSQQLFFAQQHSNFEDVTNFEIDSGFPHDCSPSGLMLLEPESMTADRFYPLASGHLVIPHRFWLFQPDHYCMEDFFLDDNFNKVRRSAIICTEQTESFPATAVDHRGRLNLDFLPELETSSALMELSGRRVIRKCCDLNEVYSVANHSCIPKEGYATQYFDDLKNQEANGEDLFFHVGLLDCPDQLQAAIFAVNPDSGRLRIKMEETDENWEEVSIYCLDDFVVFFDDGFPETINLASFCPPQYPHLTPSVESVTDRGLSIPKCCPSGHIVEGNRCQHLKFGDKVEKMTEKTLLRTLQNFSETNISAGILGPNVTLSCGLSTAYPLLSAGKYVLATPSFKNDENNSLSFSLHYYVEQYWDFNVTLKPFCLDLELFRTIDEVYYEPTVWYCSSPSHVSGHYPILLYVSSAALVATFIIYFLIPASGAARFVTSLGGSRKQMSIKGRPVPMAQMLTGRNLLCHIFCLSVTFIALAIGQQEIVVPGEDTCTALGYVIYGASMGSFAWLTVYCFDYCWMFRGSFKVSDTFIFVPYSVFGWGVPILTLTIAVLAQFGNKLVHFLPDVNPNMGLVRCWFAGETSELVFFYIPVSLLLTLNIAFFLRLLLNPNLMNCTKKKNNLGPQLRINRKGTNSSRKQEDLKKAVKLFFIAGIPWVFEIIAWLPSYFKTGIPPQWRHKTVYLFEVSNLLNSLRGLIVFVMFVLLQRDVRRHLWLWLKKRCTSSPEPSGSGAEIKSQPHPHVAGSLSALSASSQRTLQSQLSSISASSDMSEPISFTSGESDAVFSSLPYVEPDEITYL